MPELPDVEVYRQVIESGALDRTVTGVEVDADRILDEDLTAERLRNALQGRTLSSTRRRGKHLFIEIGGEDRWLRLHFGMTGRVVVLSGDEELPAHTRFHLNFEGGECLAVTSQRRLGEIGLVEDHDGFAGERELGPDPSDDGVDRNTFRSLLSGRRGSVKAALMNQKVLAGLGNVYVDEILFQAGVHPEAPVEELDDRSLKAIHRTMGRVLQTAVRRGADPERMPDRWLLPRRREGVDCPRCDGTIRKSQVSGRSTYHCDSHQEERNSR